MFVPLPGLAGSRPSRGEVRDLAGGDVRWEAEVAANSGEGALLSREKPEEPRSRVDPERCTKKRLAVFLGSFLLS